ncbi:glycerate kinase [Neobacillus driksii]|uniref:glycerate kinase family protein n=1 Tax=Neobacillus driksii TaxID=3035913 RepID=UPI0027D8AD2F|nr:glycerate kinase [Neobacillus niacini]
MVNLGGWDISFYLVIFLYGYFLFTKASFKCMVQRLLPITLALSILTTVFFVYGFMTGMPAAGNGLSILLAAVKALNCWSWLLVIFAFAYKKLQALGVSFKDQDGQELPFGGGALNQLASIDLSRLDSRINNVKIDVACDVTNPLIGVNGASAVFGPQKGSTPEVVKLLDENLGHYAEVIKRVLGKDIAHIEGAGAAGGLGTGLMAFLNANLKKGVDLVIEYTGFEDRINGADYVFTGEGSIDGQTLFGMTPFGVASIAEKYSIPVIAFAGRICNGVEPLYDHGFTSIVGILKGCPSLEDAFKSGETNLAFAAENICRVLKM